MRGKWPCSPLSSLCVLLTLLTRAHTEWQVVVAVLLDKFFQVLCMRLYVCVCTCNVF
jgi:hypothetical protein